MKAKTIIIVAIASFAILTTSKATTNILFNEPETFSDVSFSQFPNDRDREYILEDLESFIVEEIDRQFGDRFTFNLIVNNVDLAGEFEPWRDSRFGSEVRIIKSIYPARISFDFEIINSKDQVIASGSENLMMMDKILSFNLRHEESPYVKELIVRWINSFHNHN